MTDSNPNALTWQASWSATDDELNLKKEDGQTITLAVRDTLAQPSIHDWPDVTQIMVVELSNDQFAVIYVDDNEAVLFDSLTDVGEHLLFDGCGPVSLTAVAHLGMLCFNPRRSEVPPNIRKL